MTRSIKHKANYLNSPLTVHNLDITTIKYFSFNKFRLHAVISSLVDFNIKPNIVINAVKLATEKLFITKKNFLNYSNFNLHNRVLKFVQFKILVAALSLLYIVTSSHTNIALWLDALKLAKIKLKCHSIGTFSWRSCCDYHNI